MSLPPIYPEGYKILIQVEDPEKITAGGIIIPEHLLKDKRRELTIATVLRVGPKANVVFEDGIEFGIGSHVIFSKYGGFNIADPENPRNGRDFRLLNDEDILALVMDEK